MFNGERIQQLEESVDQFLLEDRLDELFGLRQKFKVGDKVKIVVDGTAVASRVISNIVDGAIELSQYSRKFNAKTGKAWGTSGRVERLVKEDIELTKEAITIEEAHYPINDKQYNLAKEILRRE